MNLVKIAELLKNAPDQTLMQEMQHPSGSAPSYMILSELERRKKLRGSLMNSEPQSSVAEDMEREASQANQMGLGSMGMNPMERAGEAPEAPEGYARGGEIQGYAGGEMVWGGKRYAETDDPAMVIDPITGRPVARSLIEQSMKSPWNTVGAPTGAGQDYSPSTKKFLAGEHADSVANYLQGQKDIRTAIDNKLGIATRAGNYYPFVEGDNTKVMYNGAPTSINAIQGVLPGAPRMPTASEVPIRDPLATNTPVISKSKLPDGSGKAVVNPAGNEFAGYGPLDNVSTNTGKGTGKGTGKDAGIPTLGAPSTAAPAAATLATDDIQARLKGYGDELKGLYETQAKRYQDQADELKKSKSSDIGMALMQAGLGIAGGRSQYAMENIGQGAMPAMQAYMGMDRERRKELQKLALGEGALGIERVGAQHKMLGTEAEYGLGQQGLGLKREIAQMEHRDRQAAIGARANEMDKITANQTAQDRRLVMGKYADMQQKLMQEDPTGMALKKFMAQYPTVGAYGAQYGIDFPNATITPNNDPFGLRGKP